MSQFDPVPEYLVKEALEIGVAAIQGELASTATPPAGEFEIDRILRKLDPAELEKARTMWLRNAPSVVLGYGRRGHPMPMYAVTVGDDSPSAHFIGQEAFDGAMASALEEADLTGRPAKFTVRSGTTINVWVYAENQDAVTWNYQIAKRIMRVATLRFLRNGLQEPEVRGADLLPNPKYQAENLYMRRLSVSFEYNESWTDQGSLWAALNGAPDPRLPMDGGVQVRHRDSEPFPGGVTPYTPSE